MDITPGALLDKAWVVVCALVGLIWKKHNAEIHDLKEGQKEMIKAMENLRRELTEDYNRRIERQEEKTQDALDVVHKKVETTAQEIRDTMQINHNHLVELITTNKKV